MPNIGSPITFIHKDGRIIPIRAPSGGGGRPAPGASKPGKKTGIVNKGRAIASTAISIAEGAATGLSLRFGIKKAASVHALGLGVDVASTAVAASAYAGKGHGKQRAVGFAKLEALNHALGWGTYGAVALSHKGTRDAAVSALRHSSIVRMARKVLVGA